MAKTVATILGIGFVIVGIAGFFKEDLLGAHLTTVHNVVHLVSGVLALWIGGRASLAAARTFCLVFGVVYLGLGVAGFLLGKGDDKMLTVLPDQLMLGTRDHLVHVLLGALFVIGGLATRAGGGTATTYPPR